MSGLKNIRLCALLSLLFFTGCGIRKYVNPEYQRLLMYSESPVEVLNHRCEGGLLQFQLFDDATQNMCDTIVILKFDTEDRFGFYGGISIGKDYERFEDMTVFNSGDSWFFTVRARNGGNAKGNAQYVYRIDPRDCTLHSVEVVKASTQYRETLPDSLMLWDDEIIRYDDKRIWSEFYVWKQGDTHFEPTGGKVFAVYGIERIGKLKYRLRPREMNFTPGIFKL